MGLAGLTLLYAAIARPLLSGWSLPDRAAVLRGVLARFGTCEMTIDLHEQVTALSDSKHVWACNPDSLCQDTVQARQAPTQQRTTDLLRRACDIVVSVTTMHGRAPTGAA